MTEQGWKAVSIQEMHWKPYGKHELKPKNIEDPNVFEQ